MYQTFSEGELKQLLDELKAELVSAIRGDRFLSISTGGKSFTRRVRSYSEIQANLGDVTAALQAKNPLVYGSPTNKTYVYGGSKQDK